MKIQIALPFLMIIVSLLTMRFISFKTPMTPGELRMIGYVPEEIEMQERQPFIVERELKSPFGIVKTPTVGYPSVSLSALAPEVPEEIKPPPELKVSLILVTEGRRMAIMNGLVVKEGDSIAGMKIEKIEKNRILLKEFRPSRIDKQEETRWVYLEEKK